MLSDDWLEGTLVDMPRLYTNHTFTNLDKIIIFQYSIAKN